jgi:DNA-binding SARP family transcriptional activator/predicted ATPase
MPDALHITTLGGLEIRCAGQPIQDFALRKSEALLVYLAVTGRPHSREELAGLLWAEASERNARAYLRRALAELRGHVDPFLTITRRDVTLNRARSHWLDVEAFDQAVYKATGRPKIPLGEGTLAALTEAVGLYRGDFLQGFHVRQALAFEEWALVERERLTLCALRALHTLTDHYAALGAYMQAIAYTERLLALEPGQEEAHRRMMTLLALSGQSGAALLHYRDCRRFLAEELGVEPDASIISLYEKIKAGEIPKLDRQPQVAVPSLPMPLTPFVGRDAELAAIKSCLEHPACRLLTLIGPGGSGKTRLALEAASELTSQSDNPLFEHGVYFILLESLDPAQVIVPTLAKAFGFVLHKGADSRNQLMDYLRSKHTLLVFDGFEHLLETSQTSDAVGLVTDILGNAPGVKALVTSRARLKTSCEHLLQVGGLEYPRDKLFHGASTTLGQQCEGMIDYSSMQLFLTSARRLRPDLKLTSDAMLKVAQICRVVEGMPLAILLAAGWVRMLTIDEIAARLSDHDLAEDIHGLDLLQTDWRDIPKRQRSMRVVFDHSSCLLTDHEREVFAALSVFRGGFTGEAAWHVCGASLKDLMALADKSMLYRASSGSAAPLESREERRRSGARYKMHGLLREYAAEILAHAYVRRRAAVCDRHCAYFSNALKKWGVGLQGSLQRRALAEIDLEAENVRAAWEWSASNACAQRLHQAMDALCYFYKWRGRYQEGAQACQLATERLSAAGDVTESHTGLLVRARALAWQGVFHWRLGNSERASQLLSQSQDLLDHPGLANQDTRSEKAFLLWRVGRMAFDTDRAQSRPLYEESLALYRELDDRWGAANVLEDLSWVARCFSDYRTAQRLGEESLDLRRALNDHRGMLRSLRALCSIAYRQGRLNEAERLIRESSAIPLQQGNPADIGEKLSSSGRLSAILGRFEEGRDRLVESRAIWDDLGLPRQVASVDGLLGGVTLHLGRYGLARDIVRQGLSIAREIGDRGRTAFALFVLGWVSVAQGAFLEARESAEESAKLYQEIGEWAEVGEALAILGYAFRGLRQYTQANRHFCAALRMATELQAFLPALYSLPGAALLLAEAGELVRAVEVYALASRYAFVANSRWFQDVVESRMSLAVAALPPDVVGSAQERGKTWDVWQAAAELIDELGKAERRSRVADMAVAESLTPAHAFEKLFAQDIAPE